MKKSIVKAGNLKLQQRFLERSCRSGNVLKENNIMRVFQVIGLSSELENVIIEKLNEWKVKYSFGDEPLRKVKLKQSVSGNINFPQSVSKEICKCAASLETEQLCSSGNRFLKQLQDTFNHNCFRLG